MPMPSMTLGATVGGLALSLLLCLLCFSHSTATAQECQPGMKLVDGEMQPCREGHQCNNCQEMPCPRGSVQPSPGSASCNYCLDDQLYQPNTGKTECLYCTAGFYSLTGISRKACPIGHACPDSACNIAPCIAGLFQDTEGQASCKMCAAGKFSGQGASTCIMCAAGTYQDEGGQPGCKECSTCPTGFDTTSTCIATQDTVCQDNTPPTITLINRYDGLQVPESNTLTVFVRKGTTFNYPLVYVTDTSLDANLTAVPTNPIPLDAPGTQELVYQASDASGNTAVRRVQLTITTASNPFIDIYHEEVNGGTALTPTLTIDILDTSMADQDSYFLVDVDGYGADGTSVDQYLTVNVAALNLAAVGNYTIEYTLSIPGVDPVVAQRPVHIVDTNPPRFRLHWASGYEVAAGVATIEAGMDSFENPTATLVDDVDPNPTLVVKYHPYRLNNTIVPSGSVFIVQFIGTDQFGNTASKNATINIVDTMPPVLSLVGDAPLTHEAGSTFVDAGATASDVLDAKLGINTETTLVFSNATNVPSALTDVANVKYSACDVAGNCDTITRIVTFQDTTAPSLLARSAVSADDMITVTLENNESQESLLERFLSAVDVADNFYALEDITITINTTGVVFLLEETALPVSYRVPVTVADPSENSQTQEITLVIVADGTPPTVTLVGDASISLTSSMPWTDPGVTAVDNQNVSITESVTVSVELTSSPAPTLQSVNTFARGACMYSDATFFLGQPSSRRQFSVPAQTAVDSSNSFHGLEYSLTYHAVDAVGNYMEATRVVSFTDSSRPVISLNAADVEDQDVQLLEINTRLADPGASALHSLDGDLSDFVCAEAKVIPGNGFLLEADARAVGVRAIESVKLFPGRYESQRLEEVANKTALFNEYPVGTAIVVIYRAWSRFGREANEKFRAFVLVDTTAPQITLEGLGAGSAGAASPFVVYFGTEFREPGFTAVDNHDGNVAPSVLIAGVTAISAYTPGAYVVTYSASDIHNNTASVVRHVTVEENVFPPEDKQVVLYFHSAMGLDGVQDGDTLREVEAKLRVYFTEQFLIILSSGDIQNGGQRRRRSAAASHANVGRSSEPEPSASITFGVRDADTFEWKEVDAFIAFVEANKASGSPVGNANVVLLGAAVVGSQGASTTVSPRSSRSSEIAGIAAACAILVVIVAGLIYALFKVRSNNQARQKGNNYLLKDHDKRGMEMASVAHPGSRYPVTTEYDDDDDDSVQQEARALREESKKYALQHTLSDTNFALYNDDPGPTMAEVNADVRHGWNRTKQPASDEWQGLSTSDLQSSTEA